MLVISFFFWILKVVSFIQTETLIIGNIFISFYVYDTIISISFDGALTDQVTSNALKKNFQSRKIVNLLTAAALEE